MKNFKILLVAFSAILMLVSCEKENDSGSFNIPDEQVQSNVSANEEITIGDIDKSDFDNLIYKGKTYTKAEVMNNEKLSSLIKQPEFFFVNSTPKKTDYYLYDTEAEQLMHNEQLDLSFEKQEILENESIEKNGRIRAVVEFFRFNSERVRSYRKVFYYSNRVGTPVNVFVNTRISRMRFRSSTSRLSRLTVVAGRRPNFRGVSLDSWNNRVANGFPYVKVSRFQIAVHGR
ncbi:hypothetical protein [Aquimarina agarilytica]|uniref:hypothetical protein n=1 Tax=Aquimarina agarilytica TaxID=1087449 RepID=UPI000287F53F|nr:hypothetical protein [Aquimarina agarilytica]